VRSEPLIAIRHRILAALAVGFCTLTFTYLYLHFAQPHTLGYDFTWPWRAARLLLEGKNPYTTIRATGPFPFDGTFNYPLPAALIAVPFAPLAPDVAAAAFSGASAALLAFALAKDDFDRFVIFLSPPFIITACSGQWSTLMMAAAVLPAISWLSVCKPTIGGAAFLAKPNWIAVVVGGSLILLSFLVLPSWVADWYHAFRSQPGNRYLAPWQVWLGGGPLLLLAALQWRKSDARWLLVLSIAPQVLTMYSAFPPMLVAKTRRQALTLSALSSVAYIGINVLPRSPGLHREREPILDGYWIVPWVFLPALVMVLTQPRE
jgi:hypothetical protein